VPRGRFNESRLDSLTPMSKCSAQGRALVPSLQPSIVGLGSPNHTGLVCRRCTTLKSLPIGVRDVDTGTRAGACGANAGGAGVSAIGETSFRKRFASVFSRNHSCNCICFGNFTRIVQFSGVAEAKTRHALHQRLGPEASSRFRCASCHPCPRTLRTRNDEPLERLCAHL
jgi:hypothetical protein